MLNIFIVDCFRKLFSPDHMGQFNVSAVAKNKVSFECVEIDSAFDRLINMSFSGTFSILNSMDLRKRSRSISENPDLYFIISLFLGLLSSSNNLYGANNFTSSENNMSSFFVCKPLPLAIIAENISLASTTNFIIYNLGNSFLNSFHIPSFMLSDSSLASSSVNLDLETILSNLSLSDKCDLVFEAFSISLFSAILNSSFDSSGIFTLIDISAMICGVGRSLYSF